jgi:multicomponent Na+:H+ antiporter subunit B
VTTVILATAARFLLPLLLLFSLFLLAVGHNEPGGGFVGGLVAASAFALYAIAYGEDAVRGLLRVDLRVLAGLGLTLVLASGIIPMTLGQPFLTGRWWTLRLGEAGPIDLGTPLLFDAGVYLVVLGTVLTIILTLAEE